MNSESKRSNIKLIIIYRARVFTLETFKAKIIANKNGHYLMMS